MIPLAAAGQTFAHTAFDGSLLLAVPVALAAGLVSFLSPCVLPLVPGYLSYVTGLSGADLTAARRGRMVAGALLFVVGFGVWFLALGAVLGGLGSFLADHQQALARGLGIVTILLGLAFAGVLPLPQRDLRIHQVPAVGLAAAPLLGLLFGLGWTPCIGPTLGAVLGLATTQGTAARGTLLMVAYVAGLGLPFVLAAVAFRRALGAFGWVRRHGSAITKVGGVLLVTVGVLLVTGAWDVAMAALRQWAAGFTPVV